MKRHVLGKSCFATMLILCAGIFALLLTFSIVFTQGQAGRQDTSDPARIVATPTLLSTQSAQDQKDHDDASTLPVPQDAVTIEFEVPTEPAITATPQVIIFPTELASVTATPTGTVNSAHLNLGTLTYSITLTAEVSIDRTRIAQYRNGVHATRTAIAEQSQIIYPTLTARAATQAANP